MVPKNLTVSEISDLIICPDCYEGLSIQDDIGECAACEAKYSTNENGALDLRLQQAKVVQISVEVGPTYDRPEPSFGVMRKNPDPQIEFDAAELPIHLTTEMASYIPQASSGSSCCLDLGCGNGEYRHIIEKAGYRWVGVDYSRPNAPMLADAHALPFRDNTFEFVISLAVLEHLKNPTVALREIRRVLKPGGVYLGSVAYLVPFHDWASYYNMTHHGVWAAMDDAGLETEFVFGDKPYLGIRALSKEGLFPGLKRETAYAIVQPIVWLHRWYWNRMRRKNINRSTVDWQSLLNTGAFVYRAFKSADS